MVDDFKPLISNLGTLFQISNSSPSHRQNWLFENQQCNIEFLYNTDWWNFYLHDFSFLTDSWYFWLSLILIILIANHSRGADCHNRTNQAAGFPIFLSATNSTRGDLSWTKGIGEPWNFPWLFFEVWRKFTMHKSSCSILCYRS